MEMNESSRWTEEEMETAKKGEGSLRALTSFNWHPSAGEDVAHWALNQVLWCHLEGYALLLGCSQVGLSSLANSCFVRLHIVSLG